MHTDAYAFAGEASDTDCKRIDLVIRASNFTNPTALTVISMSIWPRCALAFGVGVGLGLEETHEPLLQI